MPDFIKDGTGGGFLAKVDLNNRVYAFAVAETEAGFVNRVKGLSFSGLFYSSGITAASAENTIIYLKNTSSDKDLVVTRLTHRTEDAAGSIAIYLGATGTPAGTTELTPTNRNAGSANAAECEFYYGTNITGLTGGNLIAGSYFDPSLVGNNLIADPPDNIILPPQGVMTIKANNNTAKHFGGVLFYFRERS